MYEIGTAKTFTAWHVMPGAEGPEGELHAHDYRVEVIVRRRLLDARGMVVDLDVLEAALEGAVARVRDQDLDRIRPPDATAVTVEVLARWAHGELAGALAAEGADELSVRAYEDPVSFGGYAGPINSS